jgi:hypothetical protein
LFTQNGGSGALISECGRYRYRLWRLWDDERPVMVWVMLNPSTADADANDPTIRKCIGFAKQHHHGGIIVVNLFAYRATIPQEIGRLLRFGEHDPIGHGNDEHIQWACSTPILATVVAGWGAMPFATARARQKAEQRATTVSVMLRSKRNVKCFGKSKQGQPRHPLMLPYSTPLETL